MGIYQRLSIEEREEVSRFLAQGFSLREIARSLKRNPSTISREIQRFTGGRRVYRALTADRRAKKARSGCRLGKRKLVLNPRLLKVVRSKLLGSQWSPEQIAEFLRKRYRCPSMRVSAESIYTYIYVFLRRELRSEFTRELRQSRKKRRVLGKSAKGQSQKFKEMVLIDERPKEVMDRLVPGHWEGDLMIGGGRTQSALGTLIERRTRFAILVPLKNKTSEEVRKQFAREMLKVPAALRKTLTYDQGTEMAQHTLFTKQTKMKVYFAHPQSPWERATNENTNGLVRQYFPKGTDFRTVSRAEIKRVQKLLNTRPRKTLGWKTPQEAMQKLLR